MPCLVDKFCHSLLSRRDEGFNWILAATHEHGGIICGYNDNYDNLKSLIKICHINFFFFPREK